MNIQKIQTLIAESNILTDTERAYWIAALPKMSDVQLEKLGDILTKAKKIPWTAQVQKYFSFITKSANKAA